LKTEQTSAMIQISGKLVYEMADAPELNNANWIKCWTC